jgi:hypothetical protein
MPSSRVPGLKGRLGRFGTESDGKANRRYRQPLRFYVVSSMRRFLAGLVIGVRIPCFLATELPLLFNARGKECGVAGYNLI